MVQLVIGRLFPRACRGRTTVRVRVRGRVRGRGRNNVDRNTSSVHNLDRGADSVVSTYIG